MIKKTLRTGIAIVIASKIMTDVLFEHYIKKKKYVRAFFVSPLMFIVWCFT